MFLIFYYFSKRPKSNFFKGFKGLSFLKSSLWVALIFKKITLGRRPKSNRAPKINKCVKNLEKIYISKNLTDFFFQLGNKIGKYMFSLCSFLFFFENTFFSLIDS
jgi:hypothetical protein